MKTLTSFSLIGLIIFLSACKTPSDRTLLNTESTIQVTVEVAMKAWNDYIPVGKPSLEKQRKVKQAYEKYQLSMLVVVDTSASYASLLNLGTNTVARQKIDMAILSAAKASAELIQLLTDLGVKF